MQALQNTLNTIATHLRGLSSTAKLLIGALMVILVMTLFLVAQYAGRNTMEPLGLKAGLSGDSRARAIAYLQNRSIPHRERGGEIFVPADQRYSIIAQLTDGEVITPDQINFDTLVQQDSPFLSRRQNEQRWLIATMNVLERTISSMSGIENARVLIDEPKSGIGIGKAHVPASASVTVRSRTGGLSQSKIDAIAEMVAGAHAHLPIDHVRVIDAVAGTVHRARSSEAMAAAGNLQFQNEKEESVRAKISDFLAYIPGVSVAVNLTLDTKQIIQQRQEYDEPKLGITGESTRTLSSTQQSGGGEAGVRPNTGLSITGRGGRSTSMTDDQSTTSMTPYVSSTSSRIHEHRAHALQINAAIGVPRSYFVRLYRDSINDPEAVPDPDELSKLIVSETERIKSQVEPLVDTSAVDGAVAGAIDVSMVPDFAFPMIIGSGSGDIGGSAAGGALGELASSGMLKHIGLGALALLSLAMMFLMVRKATVQEPVPSTEELLGVPPSITEGDSDLVGEAGESMATLEGVELDDDSVRRQQMLEQINQMAHSSPHETVALLRRWIKAPM